MSIDQADALFNLAHQGPGEWTGSAQERFARPDGGMFGGYPVGLTLSAVLREPERRGTPVALTGAFLRGAVAGPLAVTTQVLRTGRSLQVWRAQLLQADKTCLELTVTLAQRPTEGASFAWVEPPPTPPPELLPRDVGRPGTPAFLDNFDRRPLGEFFRDPPDGVTIEWARDAGGGRLDYPRLAMIADKFPPRSGLVLGRSSAASTISNSIYFHASEEEVAEVGDDFVLMYGRGRRGYRGVCDLTAGIWRRDGLLLATTEQMWWFS